MHLLRLVQDSCGEHDELATIVRHQVAQCRSNIRMANGTIRLQAVMNDMLQRIPCARSRAPA